MNKLDHDILDFIKKEGGATTIGIVHHFRKVPYCKDMFESEISGRVMALVDRGEIYSAAHGKWAIAYDGEGYSKELKKKCADIGKEIKMVGFLRNLVFDAVVSYHKAKKAGENPGGRDSDVKDKFSLDDFHHQLEMGSFCRSFHIKIDGEDYEVTVKRK